MLKTDQGIVQMTQQKREFSDTYTNFAIGPMFQLNASVFIRVKVPIQLMTTCGISIKRNNSTFAVVSFALFLFVSFFSIVFSSTKCMCCVYLFVLLWKKEKQTNKREKTVSLFSKSP